jgi:hypothetical protein
LTQVATSRPSIEEDTTMDINPLEPELLTSNEAPKRRSRRGRSVAILAAGLVAGGALAGAATAFGSSSSPSTSANSSGSTSTTTPSDNPAKGTGKDPGPGGATPVRSDEKALSTSVADQVKAAALKAVPGGTIIRVETDAGDGYYEAHMKKADGTLVTVKLTKAFALIKVETGMGLGDPRGAGGPGGHGPGGQGPAGHGPGDHDGDGPGAPSGTGTTPSA